MYLVSYDEPIVGAVNRLLPVLDESYKVVRELEGVGIVMVGGRCFRRKGCEFLGERPVTLGEKFLKAVVNCFVSAKN